MKPFKLIFYSWNSEKEEYDNISIGEFDTIKECISFAKKYSKLEPSLKTFKWEKFDQISYLFEVIEYRDEIIHSLKLPMYYASGNLEEIIYEKCYNLDKFVKY